MLHMKVMINAESYVHSTGLQVALANTYSALLDRWVLYGIHVHVFWICKIGLINIHKRSLCVD